MTTRTLSLATPVGPARATIQRPPRAKGTLILGHGAGGQGWSSDIQAIVAAAVGDGWATILVDQPWRVAGRSVASPPATLDVAWVPIVAALMGGRSRMPRPLVVGGRSAGARVACRTAQAVGAEAVLAISFPLHPPGQPSKSRAAELLEPIGLGLPLHVVQGERDPFGTPAEVRAVLATPDDVSAVPGTHSFAKSAAAVAAAALPFLRAIAGE